jgi:DNA-directed RNA polymerase sigma subunit (sigma70/sigma32)
LKKQKSQTEIARELGITRQAVQQVEWRALAKLRRGLEKRFGFSFDSLDTDDFAALLRRE